MDFPQDSIPEKKDPKDIKRSIYTKYKRRVEWTRHSLNTLIEYAELRLTEGGNIENRDETQKILEAAKTLQDCLPKQDIEKEAKELFKTFQAISKVLDLDVIPVEEIQEFLELKKDQ